METGHHARDVIYQTRYGVSLQENSKLNVEVHLLFPKILILILVGI